MESSIPRTFGETLFGGSRFVRCTLTPFIILLAVIMPIAIPQWTLPRIAIVAGLEVLCLLLLAGFWLPARYGHWAFRGVAGVVSLTYLSYLVYELFLSEAPFKLFEGRGAASPRNALLAFLAIGLPSLWYALLGRFSLRPPSAEVEIDEFDMEREDAEEESLD